MGYDLIGVRIDLGKLYHRLMEIQLKLKLVLIVLTLFLGFETSAQGPPIFTDTPIMLGVQGRGIRTFGNIVSKENTGAYSQVLVVPYNLTSKLQVAGVVPFQSISLDDGDRQTGFGDAKIFAKYQIYQKDGKGKTFRGLIKLTETFPTGNSEIIPALGAGVYQTTMSMVNGYVTTKYGIYGEVGYNLTGNGLPNNLIYNIAFGLPLLPQKYPPNQLNVFLELNGNFIFEDIGNNLFLSPGIQYIAGRKILFESGIQIPLDDSAPSGRQTDYVLRIGTRILIF